MMELTLPVHGEDVAASLDDPGREPDVQDQEKLETKRKNTNMFTMIVAGILVASVVFQFAAIALNSSETLVILATIFNLVVTGTAGVKQYMLQQLDTLRCVHNKIRSEVNRLMEENNKLTRNVDGLQDEVTKLHDLEVQLNLIAQKQGVTTKQLVSLVKENGEIVKEQKALAKAAFQQQILETVLKTDRDGNFKIDEREANILILRMKQHGGVHVNEDLIRKTLVESNGSIRSVLTLIRQIGEEDDSGDLNRMVSIDETEFLHSAQSIESMQSYQN
mmetsp:Transcript_25128/g.28739  ORF Transcript_25128/g.28739 Transcript_25128/m.28739 type:complete len:276 (-) Transcript_25128:109-936(-)